MSEANLIETQPSTKFTTTTTPRRPTMTSTKAKVTQVKFAADLEVTCLMLPNGSYGIASTQIAALFSFSPNNMPRTLERLLGEGFHFLQTSSELAARKVNYLTLDAFMVVVSALAKQANSTAISLLCIHAEASLHMTIATAFGEKITQEEHRARIESGMIHRKTYPLFTKWLYADGVRHPIRYACKVIEFKGAVGLPKNTSIKDYDAYQVFTMAAKEVAYDTMRAKGLTHEEALALV